MVGGSPSFFRTVAGLLDLEVRIVDVRGRAKGRLAYRCARPSARGCNAAHGCPFCSLGSRRLVLPGTRRPLLAPGGLAHSARRLAARGSKLESVPAGFAFKWRGSARSGRAFLVLGPLRTNPRDPHLNYAPALALCSCALRLPEGPAHHISRRAAFS